jgi:hypothetical protein
VTPTPDELTTALERVLETLLGVARQNVAVAREFEASVPVFFAGAAPLSDPHAAWLAARRHAEWFLLERHSPALRGAPVERLLGALREQLAQADERAALEIALEGVLASATGAFEVEEVRGGEGAWLRDVSGLAQYALLAPELSTRLRTGDLLVGRLHPVGDGLHLASPAAGVFRGPGLVSAFERDLAALRQGPGAKLLRLGQAELEHMFFSAGGRHAHGAHGSATSAAQGTDAPPTPASIVAEGREWLIERGLSRDHVEVLLARFAEVPFDPAHVVPGLGDALGEVLDELAFETEIDLELARRRLIAVWRAATALVAEAAEAAGAEETRQRRGGESSRMDRAERGTEARTSRGEHPGASDEARARAIEEFAQNRAAGRDALAELAALRDALGLDEEDGEDDDSPAPDFPGVVGALVHEFVWETGVTQGEAAARELAPLAHLASYAEPIGLLEELGGRELVRFASFWVIERDVVADADAARALITALRRFGEWCRDEHDHDVMELLTPALDGLESSLPRVIEANQLVPEGARRAVDAEPVGDVFEVVDDAASLLADAAGHELTLTIEPRVRAHLARGDRVRGTSRAGVLSVLRVYPPEALLGR